MLKAKARQPVAVLRPDDAFRAQRVAGAHHIQQIPARVIVLPAPGVRVVEVAIENIARHFVIEAHVVIADHAGFWHGEQRVDASCKFRFVFAARARHLRRNTGYQHRFWLREIIVGGLAVKDVRLADDREILIGAQGGELRRAVQRGAFAEGFVIVEQKSRLRGRIRHQVTIQSK